MRQIAERAGLALGGIYNHFASKDDIFQTLIIDKHPYAQIVPLVEKAPGDTAEEFIRNAVNLVIENLGHRPDFIKLMFIEIVEFNGKHFSAMLNVILPRVLPVLMRMQALEHGVRKIPPLLFARSFFAMIMSYYMTEMLMSDATPPEMRDNALNGFVEIFLHGVIEPVMPADS
jgi:AcrR family transcriptional regulator